MENKPHLLMLYVQYSTFIKRDTEILSSVYNVDEVCFDTKNKKNTPIAFLKQFVFLLFQLRKYQVCLVQSSGYISFLPTVFGRILKVPTLIIAIGMDCAKLPEINYGAHQSKLLAYFTRKSFYKASKILPVHKSLAEQEYTYDEVQFSKQGIRAFCPGIKTPIVEVVNGYDTKKWKLLTKRKDRLRDSFLTVTMVTDEVGFRRKGLDLILDFARTKSNYHFTIVGEIPDEINVPDNMKIIAPVNQSKLLELYNAHEYYLQLSMFEGFPNALCESMLCGCIPIASNVSGIPDIIGDSGFLLKNKDSIKLQKLVGKAKKSALESEEVRDRIVTFYPLEKRAKDLIHQISSC